MILVFNGVGSNATMAERYLFGAEADQVLGADTSQGSPLDRQWFITDQQNNVREVVQWGTWPQWHLRYDSFGNSLGVTDGNGQSITDPGGAIRFRYTGQQWGVPFFPG